MKKPETYKVKDVRAFLNGLAEEIRKMKDRRKGEPNGYVAGLAEARKTFRIYHLAQSLARGRTWEQVEGKVSDGNRLSEKDVSIVHVIAAFIRDARREEQKAWEAAHPEKAAKEAAVA